MTYSDEQLSAYLDGELPRKLSQTLANDLKTDLVLANRLADLAAASQAVKQAFAPLLAEKIPAQILNLLQGEEIKPKNNVLPFAKNAPRKDQIIVSKWAVPIAAGFALMFGTVIGRTSMRVQDPQEALYAQMSGVINITNPLYSVLETTPSAQRVTVQQGALSVRPILSFQSIDGQFCREFQAQSKASALRGLACKQQQNWQILILRKTELMDETGYRTASHHGEGFIDALIDNLIDGNALGSDAEIRAISDGWRIKASD